MLSDFLFYKAIFPASGGDEPPGGGESFAWNIFSAPADFNFETAPRMDLGISFIKICDKVYTYSELHGGIFAFANGYHDCGAVVIDDSTVGEEDGVLQIFIPCPGEEGLSGFISITQETIDAIGMPFESGTYVYEQMAAAPWAIIYPKA